MHNEVLNYDPHSSHEGAGHGDHLHLLQLRAAGRLGVPPDRHRGLHRQPNVMHHIVVSRQWTTQVRNYAARYNVITKVKFEYEIARETEKGGRWGWGRGGGGGVCVCVLCVCVVCARAAR